MTFVARVCLLLFVTLLAACADDTETWPPMRADLGLLTTSSEGRAATFLPDGREALRVGSGPAGLALDSTYRVVATYRTENGAAVITGVSTVMVAVPHAYKEEKTDPLDVSIVANEPTEIMFLDVGRAANVCNSSCEFHNRLVKNLMRNLAGTSMVMNRRLDQLAKRSTREKICAFLSDQARAAGSSDFMIGMNRQEMADYLGVDRSAMSTELGKMQREGIIEFQKNHFVLK